MVRKEVVRLPRTPASAHPASRHRPQFCNECEEGRNPFAHSRPRRHASAAKEKRPCWHSSVAVWPARPRSTDSGGTGELQAGTFRSSPSLRNSGIGALEGNCWPGWNGIPEKRIVHPRHTRRRRSDGRGGRLLVLKLLGRADIFPHIGSPSRRRPSKKELCHVHCPTWVH